MSQFDDANSTAAPMGDSSEPEGAGRATAVAGEKLAEPTGRALEPSAGLAPAGQVEPSQCASCAAAVSGPLVYAIGQLGYEFGTEARRDSITEQMRCGENRNPHPYKALELLAYLAEHPWDAAAVIWTLSHDGSPVYAIQVSGPFADHVGAKLRGYLAKQKEEEHAQHVERVAIPGRVVGQARLLTGQTVPVIQPEPRGMRDWCTRELVGQVVATMKQAQEALDEPKAESRVRNFLERVCHEHRNLGLTPQERALNYTATSALSVGMIYKEVLEEKEEMELDTVEVERSPVCRRDSDCWDVKLLFFYSKQPVQTVRRVYRLTVDVSDVVPVAVGEIHSWAVR